MEGLWVVIYPWVIGPLLASLLLLRGERSRGARSFAALSLALAVANYVAWVVWWREGCWDAGIPCGGRAINDLPAYLGAAAVATGLICLAWLLAIWMAGRRHRVA